MHLCHYLEWRQLAAPGLGNELGLGVLHRGRRGACFAKFCQRMKPAFQWEMLTSAYWEGRRTPGLPVVVEWKMRPLLWRFNHRIVAVFLRDDVSAKLSIRHRRVLFHGHGWWDAGDSKKTKHVCKPSLCREQISEDDAYHFEFRSYQSQTVAFATTAVGPLGPSTEGREWHVNALRSMRPCKRYICINRGLANFRSLVSVPS